MTAPTPVSELADRLALGVPNELRELEGWLLWRRGPARPDGRFDKVPYYTPGGKRCGTQGSPEDFAKLVTFDVALARLREGGYDGLGLAMLGQGIVGLDFDGCCDGAGIIAPWVRDLCRDTYMEVSPSGTGVRAFYRGDLPDRKNHAAHLETFCRTGFLTVTGARLNGCDLAELPDAVADELSRRLGPDKARSDSAEVLSKACAQDPTLARLNELGMVLRSMGDGKFDIACPWESQHSTPGGAGDTVYFAAHTGGYATGNFDCKHSHCSERPQPEFRAALGLGAKAPGGDEPTAVYRRVADIQPKPIRWLWPGRIARGKVFMLAGHPGLGKSQAILSMTAIVTTGGVWPADRTPSERGAVIILSAEDDAEDTIRPRLEAAGADLKRAYILDAVREPNKDGASTKRPFNLTEDIDRLRNLARVLGDVALIVIDPVTAYLGRVDSHRNAEVRAVLAPLAEMAAGVEAAIVCVSHLNKTGGPEAMLRVMGSLGFVAAARGAYLVAKDPEDGDRRLFLPMKNNLAEDRGGLAFRVRGRDLGSGIVTSCVEWDAEPVTMTADEALVPAVDPEDGETTAKAEAEGWLRETLKGGDSMDGKLLKGLARDSEISVRTLYRAANAIGVVMLSGGFGKPRRWHLCPMPGKGCGVCRDLEDEPNPLHPGTHGTHGEPEPPEPSCGAGSTHACQAQKENAGGGIHDTHGSNLGGMRVPGDSDVDVCQVSQVERVEDDPDRVTDPGPPPWRACI